ncbi:MAG: ABC transporter substrate-binding protein [Anaerolineaceae bacterium]|nr:ABC transporter substrate-binding protein [Anaerolineaceae bacterium]
MLGLSPAAILAAPLRQGVACEQDAIVQADDWLSNLADKFYGDVLAFPAIVEATNQARGADDSYARIDNSDIIEPGWKLCIPSTDDAQALLTGQTSSAKAEAASGDPIIAGASLPLTGGFSVNGQKHKEGYELCADLINQAGGLLGRPLEVIVSDNRSDTETAITQHERLINVDGVDLLFGTFSSRLTFPVSAITEQNNMVYPIPSGAAQRIYERGFDTLFYFQPVAAEQVGKSPIELLTTRVPAEELPKTAAIVHADDFFANSIANGLVGGEVEVSEGQMVELPSLLADAGMELVYNEQWPEEGFADWITLANSVKNSGAEFLIGLTASPEETVQLTRALQTVGYQPKAVYLSQGTQQEYLEGVGDAANGVMIHSAWHPLAPWEGVLAGQPFSNQDFIAAYEAKYGIEPDEDVAIPFALCQGMAQAVEGAGTTDNQVLAEWLHARTEEDPVRTILGPFHWDARGLAIDKPYLMTQWQNGELKFVYPLDEFEGVSDFIYPKPEW